MKTIIIALALFPLSVFAVGISGYNIETGKTPVENQRKSVKSKVTIVSCGRGRMRSVRNYQVKCKQKVKRRLRLSRKTNSQIRNRKVYRPSIKPDVAQSTKKPSRSTIREWIEYYKAKRKRQRTVPQ